MEHIKLTWIITVGFTRHIQVRDCFLNYNKKDIAFVFLAVDDKAALTRNFVRGGQGSRTTPYYIWVPYILTLAALCTYLPAWIWHIVGHRATFDIPAMIQQVAKTNLTDPEERQKTLIILSKHYEKAQRYSKSKVNQTDNILKRALSACMFFAGGGVLTGTIFIDFF